jgi:hypothetical protein
MASNFTLILAPSGVSDTLEDVLYSLKHIPDQYIHSIFILLSSVDAFEDLQSSIKQLQQSHKKTIRVINWDANQLETNFEKFVNTAIYQMDASKDCWLFMDLRKQEIASPKFTSGLINQAFSVWKENADSILSFDPYQIKTESPVTQMVENKRQAPFYYGAAFMHPVRF